MWKLTLGCNVLLLILLWLLSVVVITPAYNVFVQYGSYPEVLPRPTGIAIRYRILAGLFPLCWAIATVIMGKWLAEKPIEICNEYVSLHTSVTIFTGLALLLYFSLAAILPFLLIGVKLP